MSSILILPRSFSTTLIKVGKDGATQLINAGSFVTVTMNAIASDAGNNWDAATNHYVVPSTGLYQITATLRTNDLETAGKQFGLGVHTSNSDGSWFLWHSVQNTINQEKRTTYPYIRTDFFVAGDRLRMFSYSDQGYVCAATVLNIFRVA